MLNQSQRATLKQMVENPITFATTLSVIILDQFGTDALDWEPRTFRMEFKELCDADIPQTNMDKIQAVILLLTTNRFYIDVESFNHVMNSFGDNGPDFITFDPAHVDEITWGILESSIIDPTDMGTDKSPFSDEIRSFVGLRIANEGMLSAPNLLAFAEVPEADPYAEVETDSAQYKMMFTRAQNEKDQVTAYVKERLGRLALELKVIPLEDGSMSELHKIAENYLTALN